MARFGNISPEMWKEAAEKYSSQNFRNSVSNSISNFLQRDYDRKQETACECCGETFKKTEQEEYIDDSAGLVKCCPACYEISLQTRVAEVNRKKQNQGQQVETAEVLESITTEEDKMPATPFSSLPAFPATGYATIGSVASIAVSAPSSFGGVSKDKEEEIAKLKAELAALKKSGGSRKRIKSKKSKRRIEL